jgi:hypothetical protein
MYAGLQAQVLILKIHHVFLRLKLSPSLTLSKIEHFAKISLIDLPGPVSDEQMNKRMPSER